MAASIIATAATRRARRPAAAFPPKVALLVSEQTPAHVGLAVHERAVIDAALHIIAAHWCNRGGVTFDAPSKIKEYMRLQLGCLEREVFGVMFLDTRHQLIAFEQMFRGTLSQTSVYPREIVKRALALNAAAVVLAHNHPSGVAEPSRADELLTQGVRAALQLVDVQVLDHMVVGCNAVMSFAERGLI